MAKRTATFKIEVDYDDDKTTAEAVGEELDTLLTTALSTPGILDAQGEIEVGEFELWGDAPAPLQGPLYMCGVPV